MMRVLETTGGVPADAASRSVTAVSALISRELQLAPFELLTLVRLLSALRTATGDPQLVERAIATLRIPVPPGCPADAPDAQNGGVDDDTRSALAAQVETAVLLGRDCPARPGALLQLHARAEAIRDGHAFGGDDLLSLEAVSAVDNMTILAQLDPALRRPAGDAAKTVLEAVVSSYSAGARLTRLDVRVIRVLRDDAARLAVDVPPVPDPVLEGAARLVRWRASFPDAVEGGGNVMSTILGLHALQLLDAGPTDDMGNAPLTQTRNALRDQAAPSNWSDSDRWLLGVGVGSTSPPPSPDPDTSARYPGIILAAIASGRMTCTSFPGSVRASTDVGAEGASAGDLIALAASAAASARCLARPVDTQERERLAGWIEAAIEAGSVMDVWQAAEASCLLATPPHGLDVALDRIVKSQILPSGGVTVALGGLPDVAATYAYLRLRSLADGCSPGWWTGYA
ncbi:MAG: hypothetical protein ACR2GH_17690 [Pseudonocardia sp.]